MPALPTGTISLWFGSVASIPAGFTLCDGTNGTPDLRDRFIIGAAGTHAPGATGGATSHTHTFTGDGHTHGIPFGTVLLAGVTFDTQTTINPAIGTTDAGTNLPPYHALVFIMKT